MLYLVVKRTKVFTRNCVGLISKCITRTLVYPWVYVAMSAAPVRDASQPIVYVNGKRHELPQGKAETTLLQYLRGTLLPRAATLGVSRFSDVHRPVQLTHTHISGRQESAYILRSSALLQGWV